MATGLAVRTCGGTGALSTVIGDRVLEYMGNVPGKCASACVIDSSYRWRLRPSSVYSFICTERTRRISNLLTGGLLAFGAARLVQRQGAPVVARTGRDVHVDLVA